MWLIIFYCCSWSCQMACFGKFQYLKLSEELWIVSFFLFKWLLSIGDAFLAAGPTGAASMLHKSKQLGTFRARLFCGISDENSLCREFLTVIQLLSPKNSEFPFWMVRIHKASPLKLLFLPIELSEFQFPKCYIILDHLWN